MTGAAAAAVPTRGAPESTPASPPGAAAPLSLLFVTPGYPPVLGGAEMHAHRLAGALAARGHRVHVLTMAPAGGAPAARVDPPGVTVSTVGRARSPEWQARAFVAATAAAVLRGRRRHDAVHVFLPGLHVAAAAWAGRLVGTPVVVMYGSSADRATLQRTRVGRFQLRAACAWASRLIVLNDAMRAEFEALGVAADRIVSFPCEVDTSEFSPPTAAERAGARAALGVPPAAPVVVFVGRLTGVKRVALLVDAVASLRARFPDAVLLVVGDGPERAALELRAAAAPGAPRVRFAGALDAGGVRDALRAGDVFALVSETEGIPCALVEAMACGLPSVVSDIPGTAPVAHDVHGLRVEGDVAAVAGALAALLADPARRARLGAAARERAMGEYAATAVAAAHERLYAALRPGA